MGPVAMDTSEAGGFVPPLSPATLAESQLFDEENPTTETLTCVTDAMSGLNVNSPQPEVGKQPREPEV